MRNERPELARRIPGATNAGPASPAQCPLTAAMVERLRVAVDAARANAALGAGQSPGLPDAVDPRDLVLHQASEEPGSRWAAAPSPSGERPAPNERKVRSGRFRVSFPLLKLWR